MPCGWGHVSWFDSVAGCTGTWWITMWFLVTKKIILQPLLVRLGHHFEWFFGHSFDTCEHEEAVSVDVGPAYSSPGLLHLQQWEDLKSCGCGWCPWYPVINFARDIFCGFLRTENCHPWARIKIKNSLIVIHLTYPVQWCPPQCSPCHLLWMRCWRCAFSSNANAGRLGTWTPTWKGRRQGYLTIVT